MLSSTLCFYDICCSDTVSNNANDVMVQAAMSPISGLPVTWYLDFDNDWKLYMILAKHRNIFKNLSSFQFSKLIVPNVIIARNGSRA